eukprot:4418346-Alexandrium_andersonii.AAC.1
MRRILQYTQFQALASAVNHAHLRKLRAAGLIDWEPQTGREADATQHWRRARSCTALQRADV